MRIVNQSLLDKLFGQYEVIAYCFNCNVISYIKIKKGLAIRNFFTYNRPLCPVCGYTLEPYNPSRRVTF